MLVEKCGEKFVDDRQQPKKKKSTNTYEFFYSFHSNRVKAKGSSFGKHLIFHRLSKNIRHFHQYHLVIVQRETNALKNPSVDVL